MTKWNSDGFDEFCRNRGEKPDDEVIQEIKRSLFEYEEELFRKHGYRQRATYCWRGLEEHGAIKSLRNRVLRPRISSGFKLLIAAGRPKETDECFALRYRDRIGDDEITRNEVVRVAQGRLLRAGVDPARCGVA